MQEEQIGGLFANKFKVLKTNELSQTGLAMTSVTHKALLLGRLWLGFNQLQFNKRNMQGDR